MVSQHTIFLVAIKFLIYCLYLNLNAATHQVHSEHRTSVSIKYLCPSLVRGPEKGRDHVLDSSNCFIAKVC